MPFFPLSVCVSFLFLNFYISSLASIRLMQLLDVCRFFRYFFFYKFFFLILCECLPVWFRFLFLFLCHYCRVTVVFFSLCARFLLYYNIFFGAQYVHVIMRKVYVEAAKVWTSRIFQQTLSDMFIYTVINRLLYLAYSNTRCIIWQRRKIRNAAAIDREL